MRIPTVKELVREQAILVKYHSGSLWYSISWSESPGVFGGHFEFPVPVEDTGDGVFGRSEKGIYLMRWNPQARGDVECCARRKSDMNWPQIVYVCMMVFGLLCSSWLWARDLSKSSGHVATLIVSTLLYQAFVVYVLHEGGFW